MPSYKSGEGLALWSVVPDKLNAWQPSKYRTVQFLIKPARDGAWDAIGWHHFVLFLARAQCSTVTYRTL